MSNSNQNAKVGKSQTGKFLGPTYKRLKGVFQNDEAKALKSILEAYPKERQNNLEPAHTKKTFVWRAKTKFD